ncbi:hypothetical protein Taro_019563 [Colocasia esculenta]|uniref:L-2-hydroxyglutarate dehydrogenase, mitochondrial n=1 Tax=Colocasia esculenta TaxID=4460 RepID=A0A843UU80_COLES|nr:hypothetical protein [Colocasia esculenta]
MLRRVLATLRCPASPAGPGGFRCASSTPPYERVPTETADVVVIGAGAVGIATARELALKGRDVLLLESASTFGTGTSSRNSEVIHAGIYYPRDSLKARLCVRGRELLYKYCSDREIPHKQIGKLIVATSPSEVPKLQDLLRRGTENGVVGLRMLGCAEAMQLEPEVRCVQALLSPCSGIVDSHSFMLSLLGEAECHKTTLSFNTTVTGGHVKDGQIQLLISETKNVERELGNHHLVPQLIIIPKLVINAAGLSAIPLAKRFHGLCHGTIPPPYYARGCYFILSKVKIPPFSRLIYPLPEDGGIGIHVTLDLDGHVKFGPDVEWIDSADDISSFLNRFDYSVDPSRSGRFYAEIQKYYPNLKGGSLDPGYAGIRAKLSGPGMPPTDFVIQYHRVLPPFVV